VPSEPRGFLFISLDFLLKSMIMRL